MPEGVWQQCVSQLRDELPAQQFNTWIRPLGVRVDENALTLFAPNRFIKDFVAEKYSGRICELVRELQPDQTMDVTLAIGTNSACRIRVTAAPSNPGDIARPDNAGWGLLPTELDCITAR